VRRHRVEADSRGTVPTGAARPQLVSGPITGYGLASCRRFLSAMRRPDARPESRPEHPLHDIPSGPAVGPVMRGDSELADQQSSVRVHPTAALIRAGGAPASARTCATVSADSAGTASAISSRICPPPAEIDAAPSLRRPAVSSIGPALALCPYHSTRRLFRAGPLLAQLGHRGRE
jgi:hypothetical protein